MRYLTKFFLFIIFFCIFYEVDVQGHLLSPEMGTVIVTYQTHHTEEAEKRLDRIRFWLINEQQERTLFPKKDEFVSKEHAPHERTVVISHLPPGNYRIEFLLPNMDQFFEDIPPRFITLRPSETIKIDQFIRPHTIATQAEKETEELALIVLNRQRPFPPHGGYLPDSSPTPTSLATFSLSSNQEVGWKLLLRGRIIYAGVGSVSNLKIPPGRDYAIVAESIPGYSYYTSPTIPFDVAPGQPFSIELFFQRDTGYVGLKGEVPIEVKSMTLSITPLRNEQAPIEINLTPNNGRINWNSGPLLTGEYVLSLTAPDLFSPIESQHFVVQKGNRQELIIPIIRKSPFPFVTQTPFPLTTAKGNLLIKSDSPQATFTLSTQAGVMIGQGKGYQYTFQDLNPGYYLVEFSSSNPALGPSYPSQNVYIKNNHTEQIKISYHKMGRLIINSSKAAQIWIQSSKDQKEVLNATLNPPSHTFYLPEGHYSLIYHFLIDNSGDSSLQNIHIIAAYPKTLSLSEDSNSQTLLNRQEALNKVIEKVESKREDIFIEIPEGLAILGDPFSDNLQNEHPAHEMNIPSFSIGKYEVTNLQYADWLTQALKQQKIFLGEGNQKGLITNKEKAVLCKTIDSDALSQLTAVKSGNFIQVSSILGKENYPVVNVTWVGAKAYCQDKGYRLPMESEWEKAAGTFYSKDSESPKRFKYGFGQDTIDRTWANYRDPSKPREVGRVLTTPVGFYNGTHNLPLTAEDTSSVQTHDAISPLGAYDMSGNVWEWVETDGDSQRLGPTKIVKGGCYDSLAQGVRVAERLSLPIDYSDMYTGFRVAKSSSRQETYAP